MHHLIIIFCFFGITIIVKVYSQPNIIPNGDFEKSKSSISCAELAGCDDNQNLFNSLIYNWEAAIHNNDAATKKSIGDIYYIDVSIEKCVELVLSDNSFCSVLIPSPLAFTNGTKFVRIRADVYKCKNNKKYKHGAIGVALDNGATFVKDKKYIIRYKIAPLRSRNCSSSSDDICSYNQLYCHIRFFLSEEGPKNWDKSTSDKQELINVNFAKDLCNFYVSMWFM
ncbi:MAG: hypothetical protein KatS3mg027_1259 [Bacteroidia bacterium]|nr:MAG: hypothetical protein KatS3mg027_1259 [Bacteroidia bacterium]